MTDTKNKITSAQLACIVFVLAMSLKMLVFPILVIKSCGRDAAVTIAVMLALELCCLVVMSVAVMLAPDMDFTELMRRSLGKWGMRIACAVLAVYFSLKIVLLGGEMRVFFSETLFREFRWYVYSLPLFALFAVFGLGSLRALGRSAQFLLPLIIVAMVMLFVLISPGVDYGGVLPLLEHGAGDLPKSVLRYAMWFGDFSAILVILGSVRRTRGTVGWSLLCGTLSTLGVLFFAVILSASFGVVPEFVRYGQNVTGMTQFSMGSSLRGRFDLLVFCVWMLSVLLKAGVFSMALVRCLSSVIGGHRTACGLTSMAILYLISAICKSTTGMQAFMMLYAAPFALVCLFAVPALAVTVVCRARALDARKGAQAQAEGQEADKASEANNAADKERKDEDTK